MTEGLNRAERRRIQKTVNKQRRKEEKKAMKDNSQYNAKKSNKLANSPQVNDIIMQKVQVKPVNLKRDIRDTFCDPRFILAHTLAEVAHIAVVGKKYFYNAVSHGIVEHTYGEPLDYFYIDLFSKAVEKKICDDIHSIIEGALYDFDFDAYVVLDKISVLTQEIVDNEIGDISGDNDYIASLFDSDMSLEFTISSNMDKVITSALNVAFDSLEELCDKEKESNAPFASLVDEVFDEFRNNMNMINIDKHWFEQYEDLLKEENIEEESIDDGENTDEEITDGENTDEENTDEEITDEENTDEETDGYSTETKNEYEKED
ncbi:hypothetical protein BD770DRAFT_443312 [Pilaira anomala]|nr:hypothetical protein BD770DRAFT_443312 [Pilaira anomala]